MRGGGAGAEIVFSGVGKQMSSEKGLSLQAQPLSSPRTLSGTVTRSA